MNPKFISGRLSFVPAPNLSELFIGASFDVLAFRETAFPTFDVNGWVASRGKPIASLAFTIEVPIAQMDLRYARHDVVAAFPDHQIPLACGFLGAISAVGFGTNFQIIVQAAQSGESDTDKVMLPIGVINGEQRRYFAPLERQPKLAPIFVTSLGRSGTTLTMRLLAAHPDIVAPKAYPLEIRHAGYCLKATKVMTEQCLDLGSGQSRVKDVDYGVALTGPNPFTHPDLLPRMESPSAIAALGRDVPKIFAQSAVDAIDAFYLASAKDQEKPSARYFAEKSRASFLPDMMHEIYGENAREIILLRDPRDTHASAMAFNRRRNNRGFGEADSRSDADWIHLRKALFENLMRSRRRRESRSLLVRYEDLMTNPRVALRELFAYLDVARDDATLDHVLREANKDVDQFISHRTSASGADSIGRWRRDLPADLALLANKLMKDDLVAAGYPPD